jgi:pilus assembly protein CpaB
MKNRAIIPLALGVVIGVLAIKFSVDAVRRARGESKPTIMVDAIVANQDIGQSLRITSDMLVVRKTPKTPLLPADAYTKVEDLVNRVTQKSIPQGVPIIPSMIAAEGTGEGIQERIPEGFRAVAVKIDESTGVAYLITPGCFVDVTVVMNVKRPTGKSETISRTILQRIEVGAVGQTLGDVTEEQGANRVKSVTLIVKEEDVPKLHLAQTKGKLTLALRSGADELLADARQANQSELIDGTKAPVPKPANPQTATTANPLAPPPVVVQPEQVDPVMVTVVNGSRADGADVSRLTFEGPRSMNVVGVSRGLTAGDSGGTYVPKAGTGDGFDSSPRRVLTERERWLRRVGGRVWGGASEEEDGRDSEEVTE